jgi:hypothetical protein
MREPTRSNQSPRPAVDAAPPSLDPKRRRFLFTLGVGGAGAAAASVAAFPAAAGTDVLPSESEQDAKYRETAHVRDYYRTAKL